MGNPPCLFVHVTTLESGTDQRNLLVTLREVVAGCCAFWEGLSRVITTRGEYDFVDCLYQAGYDENAIRFWPSLGNDSQQGVVTP